MAEVLRFEPAGSGAENTGAATEPASTTAAGDQPPAVVILSGCAESAADVPSPLGATVVKLFTRQSAGTPVIGAGHPEAAASEAPERGPEETGSPPARIVVSRSGGTVVVTVHGQLDLPRAGDLGTTLADLIDGQGNLSVVVDLHDATAADADCLWVFTDAAERARRHGGTITVSEPPGPIYSALQLRGLDNFVGRIVDAT